MDRIIWPRSFARQPVADADDPYLNDPAIAKLAEFFRAKGLAAIVEEDARAQWYQGWLDYQATHRLYASVLSPKQFSTLGNQFDLLKLTRLLEVFAYFSPSHGYSLQVSFLGLFSILMGSNDDLKREAVAALEAGGLFAFGVSEKDHGSDLLGNEFTVSQIASAPNSPLQFVANGRKYYIGNSNCAAIVSILARKLPPQDLNSPEQMRRAPFALIALRPAFSPGYRNIKKIPTFGVRSAFVGEFEVKDHLLPVSDFIAEGRTAWDAVFGTVTLGKFFLGFGSIGICEHAMEEAITHLRKRILYRKSVLEMPHIRLAAAQAYARLAAMKLYAYRALDYVHAAGPNERRYLLFCAIQKARVSTEGVKVLAQLSECIGAKGYEADTYFESALRDIQLIPGLEGSTHINLDLTAQFIERYFDPRQINSATDPKSLAELPHIKSLARGDVPAVENPYLMQARTGRTGHISFPHFLDAYKPLKDISNVRRFAKQVNAFAKLVWHQAKNATTKADAVSDDLRLTLGLGQCMATIAYGQLVAENAVIFGIPLAMISTMFHLLVSDLSSNGAALAALPGLETATRRLARRLIAIPKTPESDWEFAAGQFRTLEGG